MFAACVARAVKGQLAFEPHARPELEATVARLDIDFAAHVRPTASMLWSRIPKARVLDIARTVFGLAWASARSKYKKPALAEAMETAFATGEPPVGVSAAMHAEALAWTPPGIRGVRHRPDGRRRRGRGDRRRRDRTTGRRAGARGTLRRFRNRAAGCAARLQRQRPRAGAGGQRLRTAMPRTPIAAIPGRPIPTRPSRAGRTASRGPVRSTAATPTRTQWRSPSSSAASNRRPSLPHRNAPPAHCRPPAPGPGQAGGAFPFPHPSWRSAHEPHDPRPHPRERREAGDPHLRRHSGGDSRRDSAKLTARRRHPRPHCGCRPRRRGQPRNRPRDGRDATHRHDRRRRRRHGRSRASC